VSAYLLTVEPHTPLVKLIDKGRRAPVDDDAQGAAYEDVQRLLGEAGYRQYEISSHARPGEESRHNRLYWQGGAYLGVGPSAHSMRRGADGSVVRRHTTARLDAWIPDPARAAHEVETLEPAHAFREAVAFGLRDILAGVDVDEVAARHRVPAEASAVTRVLAGFAHEVERRGSRFHLTGTGARFADRVARAVLGT
jgi:oxygen-independent coproporphyrinogen-3 oxidase